MKLRKSLIKPVTRQNISSCLVLPMGIAMHDAFNVILWTSADRGRSLTVHANFGTYNFGTWVFGAVNFGTLNVNFGTCHVRYMTDQLRYMSISVHSATMTDIPSCCVLDSRHSQADLLLLKAYVEEMSRRVLFMGTHCCRRYSFQYLHCCACCLTYKWKYK